MSKEKLGEAGEDLTPLDRLVMVADAIFERAIKLDGIKLARKNDEASQSIEETRDAAFGGCIQVWKVILLLLPTSGLEQPIRKELETSAYKVISRCFHRLDNLAAARKYIIKGIDAGYQDGFISLGAICLDLGLHDEAESAFKTAIKKEVQETRAHAGLGELYFAMGTESLKTDPKHSDFFSMAEEEFVIAGKERFTEGFDRAMDLFEAVGMKDKAISVGKRAAMFYGEHKANYGGKLRSLNSRIRKLTGEGRHDRIVEGVGRKLGKVLGGKRKTH